MQEANKKAEKSMKARKMAAMFRATERSAQTHKRNNLCNQVLTRQVCSNEGFDNLEMVDPLPNKGLNHNTCTFPSGPPLSSVDSQSRGVSAAVSGSSDRCGVVGYQTSMVHPRLHGAAETPTSSMMAPRYTDGSVRGSEPACSAEKVVLADSLASTHHVHHQVDPSFHPMSPVPKNARGSHMEFKPMPLEYGSQMPMGEQRGKGVHIPFGEDWCLGFNKKLSSLPLTTLVTMDMDIAEGPRMQGERCVVSALARSSEPRQPRVPLRVPGGLSAMDVTMVKCEGEGDLHELADGVGLQYTSGYVLDREKHAAFEGLSSGRGGIEIACAWETSGSVLGTDVRGKVFLDDSRTKPEGVWIEERQAFILPRNNRDPDAEAYVGGDNVASFEDLHRVDDLPNKSTYNPVGGCKVPVHASDSRYQANRECAMCLLRATETVGSKYLLLSSLEQLMCLPPVLCFSIHSLMLLFLCSLCCKLPFMPMYSVSSCSSTKLTTFDST